MFQEQRLDIIEENMKQLDFLDKEIFSQSLTGSWFVDQDDIQKSSSNFRDFFLLTNDSSLPKAKASLKMMNYDLINSSFHTGDAYIQSLSQENFGPKFRVNLQFTESETSLSASDGTEPNVIKIALDFPLSEKRLIVSHHAKIFRS